MHHKFYCKTINQAFNLNVVKETLLFESHIEQDFLFSEKNVNTLPRSTKDNRGGGLKLFAYKLMLHRLLRGTTFLIQGCILPPLVTVMH